MADQTSSATIRVEVEGLAQIQAITQAFRALRGAAPRPRAVSAGSRVAGAITSALGLGEEVGQNIGGTIQNAVMAPFRYIGTVGSTAYGSLLSFLGPMAGMGVGVVGATTIMAGAAIAVAAIAIPAAAFAGVLRLMRSTFSWAAEATESQLQSIARTRRVFPGVVGEAFEAAQRDVKTQFGIASTIIGREAVDALDERITRMFTTSRLERGLRGERDIFARWGITAGALNEFRSLMGRRISGPDILFGFIQERERLDNIIQTSPRGTAIAQAAIRRRGQLTDDTIKIFGTNFANVINTWSTQDVERVRRNRAAAAPLSAAMADQDLNAEARAFNVALGNLKVTFGKLTEGIGLDVQPAITNILELMRSWLVSVDNNGNTMGEQLRKLASALAVHAWETLEILLRKVDPEAVQRLITRVKQWGEGQESETIANHVVEAVKWVGTLVGVLGNVFQWITAILKKLRPPGVGNITEEQLQEMVRQRRITPAEADRIRGLQAEWGGAGGGAGGGGAGGGWGGGVSGGVNAAAVAAGQAAGVRELQAGTRRLPISDELRGILQQASEATGFRVDVISGGQPTAGGGPRKGTPRHDIGGGRIGAADVKLWDPTQGRYLNPYNAADREKIGRFVSYSVGGGASGIGAAYGDMGQAIHIGGGPTGFAGGPITTWGGAKGWLAQYANAPAGGRAGPVAAGAPTVGTPAAVDVSGLPTPTGRNLTPDRKAFVAQAWPHALKASQQTGIDPRIIMAQAAHESNWGKSAPGGNYFGIKGGGGTYTTQEFVGGKMVTTRAGFAAHGSMERSFQAYADLMNRSKHYAGVRAAKGDAGRQLAALHASPYATDPQYGQKLARIINQIEIPTAAAGPKPAAAPTPTPTAPTDDKVTKIFERFDKRVDEQKRIGELVRTSAKPDTARTVSDLRQKGYAVETVMDRSGNIVKVDQDGQVTPADLSAVNIEGIEVIAKNEKDVTPRQRASIAKTLVERAKKWGYDATAATFGLSEADRQAAQAAVPPMQMAKTGAVPLPRVIAAQPKEIKSTPPLQATAALPEPTPSAGEQTKALQAELSAQEVYNKRVAELSQKPAPPKKAAAVAEGTKAGTTFVESATTAFKEETAELKIPVKSLTEEKEREAA